jgi:hypothetical protein
LVAFEKVPWLQSSSLSLYIYSSSSSSSGLDLSPLSIDRGEVTDKGSINQRAVLDHRSGLIDLLYSPTPPAHVITL